MAAVFSRIKGLYPGLRQYLRGLVFFQPHAQLIFDTRKTVLVIFVYKGNGGSFGIGPGGAPYAVYIVLGIMGHIVINYQTYVVNINAPR
jgi:hypothetical protein